MTLNIVTKREVPEAPYTCEMIDIDVESVPFVLYALWLKSQKYWYASDEDEQRGRWLLNKECVRLLMPCSRQITNLLEAQYNLLDAALRGTLRDVTGAGTDDDPFVYDEPIPQTVDPIIYTTPSMQYAAFQTLQGVRNLADGFVSTEYTDPRVFRQTLDDILAALQAETDEDTIALLQQILVALGGVI